MNTVKDQAIQRINALFFMATLTGIYFMVSINPNLCSAPKAKALLTIALVLSSQDSSYTDTLSDKQYQKIINML